MAQSERFYFWRAFYDALMLLDSDAQRGEFVRGMCLWAFDGVMPTFSDKSMQFGFMNIRDQISESVELGRKMAERGRRSGESRRKKSNGEQRSNTVQTPVRTKGKEGNGSELTAPSVDTEGDGASAPAADAARRAPSEHDLIEIPPNAPARPEGY